MPPVKSWTEYPKACDMTQWKKTCKKKYQIWVCMPKLGTKVYNKLEDSHYETNEKRPFVLSGTFGEQWIVDFDKLVKTYKFPDGTPITLDALKKKGHPYTIEWFKIETVDDPTPQWAFHVDASLRLVRVHRQVPYLHPDASASTKADFAPQAYDVPQTFCAPPICEL